MNSGTFSYCQRSIPSVAEWDSTTFGSQIDLLQLSPGKFQCQQQVLDLGILQILRLSFNQAITARGTQHTSRFAAALFDHTQSGHFSGAPILQRELLILPPHLNFDACAKDRDFGCTITFINPQSVQAYYRALTGVPLDTNFEHKHAIHANRQTAECMAQRARRLLRAAARSATMLNHPEFCEAMCDEILTLIAQSLDSGNPRAAIIPRPRFAKARQLVRQAEEYILEQSDRRVRLIDICEQTGVSERTLQYSFQEVLGMSPIHYLNQVRLHQVRRGLSSATPLSTTVSAEACRWGFLHFGEFTKAYKALFGELPSATLSRHRVTAQV